MMHDGTCIALDPNRESLADNDRSMELPVHACMRGLDSSSAHGERTTHYVQINGEEAA
jgi:hypothetical protein